MGSSDWRIELPEVSFPKLATIQSVPSKKEWPSISTGVFLNFPHPLSSAPHPITLQRGIPICHNSDAFGRDIRERGWGGGVIINNQAGDQTVGREVKQNVADWGPRKSRRQQAGVPKSPNAFVVGRVKAEQGRRETEEFKQDSTSTPVPGAWSVSASATISGSLLRARSTAEWNSLLLESRAERTSPIVAKTSSTIASAISGWCCPGLSTGESWTESGVGDVAVAGAAFGKLGESAADCGGVERGAPPPCSVSGLVEGTVEAYCSLLPAHPCSVNSCVLFYIIQPTS